MKVFLIVSLSVLGGLLILFGLFLFLIKTSSKRRAVMDKFKSLRYAHRGLHNKDRAENSLSAFRAACDEGYAIELDVRLSKDGVLVVFHDDTLDRMTTERGPVIERTAEELSKIKLADTEDTVPTFAEVLALVDGRVPLLVEIKEDAFDHSVTRECARMLAQYKGEYIVESFNPLSLAEYRKISPETVCGVLSDNFLSQKKYRKPMYFLLELLLLNVTCRPDFVAFNHKKHKNGSLRLTRRLFGAPTLAWTVRSEQEEREAKKHGFDGVIFENYIPKG